MVVRGLSILSPTLNTSNSTADSDCAITNFYYRIFSSFLFTFENVSNGQASKTITFYCLTKLVILIINSGQFNWDNGEFVNFPDFYEDVTTVTLF